MIPREDLTPEQNQAREDFVNRIKISDEALERIEESHNEALEKLKMSGTGGGNGKGKAGVIPQSPKKEPGKTEYIQKYSDGNILAEAVVIGNKPYFAVVDYTATIDVPSFIMPHITLQEGLRLDEKTILKPESTNNRPYTFKSEKEFTECIQKARNETLDSLYKKVLSMWRKYIDANDFHLKLCAADTLFSHKQDIIGMTHYLFFIADNDAGKSNNLTMFNLLAYRNMMSNSMTYANIYNFLGTRDEGAGTLCEDEADKIDEDHDKLGVYKEGYTKGHPVLRIVDTPHGRKQQKFNTFCFKAFAGERLPDAVSARGFLQRTIVLKCLPGFPKCDISEVVDPAGDDEFQILLDELNELRNFLFCYFRLLHYKDKIPNIRLNIRNREKQLFKPILRVFQNTSVFNDLLPVISKYIGDRREVKVNSFHAFLYRLVRDLINSQGSYELESGNIWQYLKLNVDYKEIPFKPQSIETVEFGIISQKKVIETLKDVFQAEPPKYHGSSRKLIFSSEIIDRMAEVYDVDVEVSVQEDDNDTLRAHRTLRTHVGLDEHMEGDNVSDEREKPIESHFVGISTPNNEASQHVRNASYASYASYQPPQTTTVQQLADKPRIYFSSGKYHCEGCYDKGDKPYMDDHKCDGSKKKEAKN